MCARGELSLVECELLTGRTHQIRAQMAHAGHPLLGDAQYGDAAFNARYGRQGQALCAYKLSFHPEEGGDFAYLARVSVRVERVPFVRELFPDFDPARLEDRRP